MELGRRVLPRLVSARAALRRRLQYHPRLVGGRIWAESAAADFERQSMRKSNSKRSRQRNAIPERSIRESSLHRRKRAASGSAILSQQSASRVTRGANTSHSSREDALLQEAIDLKSAGDYLGAVRVLKRFVRLFPGSASGFGFLGGIYLAFLNEPKKALPYCTKSVQLSPRSERASLGLFHALWSLDRVDEALEEIKRYQTLCNWTCQDYIEIIDELQEKWLDKKPRRTTKKPERPI
jgi:tetratricopeptide (TPR) repeat protein